MWSKKKEAHFAFARLVYDIVIAIIINANVRNVYCNTSLLTNLILYINAQYVSNILPSKEIVA